MLGCKPRYTPLERNWKYERRDDDPPVDKGRYQRLVGRLIYLSLTRLDITYSVSIISQFMHAPTQQHLTVIYHILRYLKGTPNKGLMFQKTKERGAKGFSNANWAGSDIDSRSMSGFYTKLWGNLVTWRSRSKPLWLEAVRKQNLGQLSKGFVN